MITKEASLSILWFGSMFAIGIFLIISAILNYSQSPLEYIFIAVFGMLLIIFNVSELLLQYYGY